MNLNRDQKLSIGLVIPVLTISILVLWAAVKARLPLKKLLE
jgi:hypothetical protein